jgi:hypothetical protein
MSARLTLHGVVFAILCLGLRYTAEEALRCVRDKRSSCLALTANLQLQPIAS